MKLRFGILTIMVLVLAVMMGGVVAQDMEYDQSPMFDEMVESGELPPVEERLPENPVVVDGLSMGEYGGTWQRVANRQADNGGYIRTFAYEPLIRWNVEWSGLESNVAESWEVSEDGRTFTFNLRQGIKWSDGVPYTSEDIMFWYNDIILNEDLNPTVPLWLTSGGEPAVVTAPDEYTVIFEFVEPAGLFLRNLAVPDAWQVTHISKHFFQDFHIDYNPENVEQIMEEEGFEDWVGVFNDYAGANIWGIARWDPRVPVLYAWMPTNKLTADTAAFRLVRNPYYWKVDSEGNQYPYLDELVFTIFQDTETMLVQAASGEIDMQGRHINALQNRPFLFDNQEQGNYSFYERVDAGNTSINVILNLNHEDEALREVFMNKDVRIALSHAINRQEIIDVIFVGQGIPHQAAPLPGTQFYDEQLATQYTEYDPEMANEILDQYYPEKNDEGIRLGPDGEPISFTMLVTDALGQSVDPVDMISRYWAEVGIDMQPRLLDRSVLDDLVQNNLHDSVVWLGENGIDVIGEPRYYMPYNANGWFGQRWQAFYNRDERTINELREETLADPEAEVEIELLEEDETFALDPQDELVYRQWELWDELKVTADEARQVELMNEILDIAAEQFYMMGISTPVPSFGIVKDDFCNVPDTMIGTWLWPDPAPTNTFTYYKSSNGECP